MATEFEDAMEGVKSRKLSTGFRHLRIHYTADPLKRGRWAKRASVFYGGIDSARWQREMEINYSAYGGQRIWPMLSNYHDKRMLNVSNCTIYRVIDQGIRHPTVCLWVAVNARGDKHIYREYYATNRSIAMNCRMIVELSKEPVTASYIDPSCRKRTHESLTSIISIYEKNGVFCKPADNSFAGYDAVGSALLSHLARLSLETGKLHGFLQRLEPLSDELVTLASKPALTFDLKLVERVFDECKNLRWRKRKGDETQTSQPEKPVDVDDDGPDCVRYAVMTQALAYCDHDLLDGLGRRMPIKIDMKGILNSKKSAAIVRRHGYGNRKYRPKHANM